MSMARLGQGHRTQGAGFTLDHSLPTAELGNLTQEEHSFIIFFNNFIYLLESEREHERWGGAEGEEEADSMLSGETNAGLDPRTLGS